MSNKFFQGEPSLRPPWWRAWHVQTWVDLKHCYEAELTRKPTCINKHKLNWHFKKGVTHGISKKGKATQVPHLPHFPKSATSTSCCTSLFGEETKHHKFEIVYRMVVNLMPEHFGSLWQKSITQNISLIFWKRSRTTRILHFQLNVKGLISVLLTKH